jgi:hypothetical protein
LFFVAASETKLRRNANTGQQKTRRPKAKAGLIESTALASIYNAPRQAENQIGASFTIRSCPTSIKPRAKSPPAGADFSF